MSTAASTVQLCLWHFDTRDRKGIGSRQINGTVAKMRHGMKQVRNMAAALRGICMKIPSIAKVMMESKCIPPEAFTDKPKAKLKFIIFYIYNTYQPGQILILIDSGEEFAGHN